MKKTLLYIFATMLMLSCSTTQYVPEGDKLYTGIKRLCSPMPRRMPLAELARQHWTK